MTVEGAWLESVATIYAYKSLGRLYLCQIVAKDSATPVGGCLMTCMQGLCMMIRAGGRRREAAGAGERVAGWGAGDRKEK